MKLKKFFHISMMVFSMVVFGTMTAFASESMSVSETEDVETVLIRDNPQQELMDVVYFRSENGVVELSDAPFDDENARFQSNNVMTGTIEYYNNGLDSQGRPGYTVTTAIYSSNLNIKSSRLMTKAENVSSWNTNRRNHSGRVAMNSRSYVYTSNAPANPYCDARLWMTDSKDFETYIGETRLRNAK